MSGAVPSRVNLIRWKLGGEMVTVSFFAAFFAALVAVAMMLLLFYFPALVQVRLLPVLLVACLAQPGPALPRLAMPIHIKLIT
jgi:hypothetical protein